MTTTTLGTRRFSVRLASQSEWTPAEIEAALNEDHGAYGPVTVAASSSSVFLEVTCASLEQLSWVITEWMENENEDEWNDLWQRAVASIEVHDA